MIGGVSLLSLAFPLSSVKAQDCFFINDPVITSSPGNPLTGSGFGNFQGMFSDVTWQGTNLGSISGTFDFTVGWSDQNQSTTPGIPWTVDPSTGVILFDTDPGDILTFGNVVLDAKLPDGYELCETKLLLCAWTDTPLSEELTKYEGLGYSLYYGYEKSSEFYEFTYSPLKGETQYISFNDRVQTTDGLSFFYSNDGGNTVVEADNGLSFDTGVKVGGCVCPVPEPSGAISLLVAGMVFTFRRRRMGSEA